MTEHTSTETRRRGTSACRRAAWVLLGVGGGHTPCPGPRLEAGHFRALQPRPGGEPPPPSPPQALHLLPPSLDAPSLARFLRCCPGLGKAGIGEVLGERDDFHDAVRTAFVRTFDFVGQLSPSSVCAGSSRGRGGACLPAPLLPGASGACHGGGPMLPLVPYCSRLPPLHRLWRRCVHHGGATGHRFPTTPYACPIHPPTHLRAPASSPCRA